MPGTAQGINKSLAFAKQVALGTPFTGNGGQKLRRTSSIFQAPRDTYESTEIVSHQQGTGVGLGQRKPSGKIDGLLSPGTYSKLFAAILRADFAAVTALSGVSLTIAVDGSNWSVTRGSGSFITGNIKIGMVVRLTTGTLNAANINKNLVVLALTATVLTVRPLNGVALVAEGPIAGCGVSIPGKRSSAPTTGHTNDFFTFEEFYADLVKSEVYNDAQIAQCQVGLPATGNSTVSFDVVALTRLRSGAQVLTTPTAETTTGILTAVTGIVMVDGEVVTNVTGAQITINGNTTHTDATVGSNVADDTQRGRILVSGNISAKFDNTALQDIFDAGSTTSLILIIADNETDTSDFVSFVIPKLKVMGDTPDDGEKAVVRAYPFTAEINGDGGAATTTDQTILTVHDSQAS